MRTETRTKARQNISSRQKFGLILEVDCADIAGRDIHMPTRESCGGAIVWFTGLSGAGKSTIATHLLEDLRARGIKADLLDGDAMRRHISRGLGFSREDRDENVRRIGQVADLLARNGEVALVSAVSPYRAVRDEIRRSTTAAFVEVYVSAPLEVCEQRDPKGLYRKARAGEIPHFTGIDDPYEPPVAAEVVCPTHNQSVNSCVASVMRTLLPRLGGQD
jgi:adenylyl-sulfate kinase